MKKFITIFITTIMLFSLVGCSSKKVERDAVLSQDLNKVLEKIYETADLEKDFKDSLQYFQITELNNSNVEDFLGKTDIKFTEGIASTPMMNAKPYELILLRLDENDDVEAIKSKIKENANPKKWVCVEAEEVVVENIDNTVLFVMGSKDEATPIKDAFMNLAQSK